MCALQEYEEQLRAAREDCEREQLDRRSAQQQLDELRTQFQSRLRSLDTETGAVETQLQGVLSTVLQALLVLVLVLVLVLFRCPLSRTGNCIRVSMLCVVLCALGVGCTSAALFGTQCSNSDARLNTRQLRYALSTSDAELQEISQSTGGTGTEEEMNGRGARPAAALLPALGGSATSCETLLYHLSSLSLPLCAPPFANCNLNSSSVSLSPSPSLLFHSCF